MPFVLYLRSFGKPLVFLRPASKNRFHSRELPSMRPSPLFSSNRAHWSHPLWPLSRSIILGLSLPVPVRSCRPFPPSACFGILTYAFSFEVAYYSNGFILLPSYTPFGGKKSQNIWKRFRVHQEQRRRVTRVLEGSSARGECEKAVAADGLLLALHLLVVPSRVGKGRNKWIWCSIATNYRRPRAYCEAIW